MDERLPATLPPGSRLGRYEIVSALGAGGMGEVFRAHDPRLGRDVAIKVLPTTLASDPEAMVRFRLEARAVAALSHPNIVAIYDVERVQRIFGTFQSGHSALGHGYGRAGRHDAARQHDRFSALIHRALATA